MSAQPAGCGSRPGAPLAGRRVLLIGAGSGGTLGTTGTVDRMIAYTKDKQYVRYPMTLLQRTPVQYSSIYHLTTYYCRLGVVEVVYPETIGYRDGL